MKITFNEQTVSGGVLTQRAVHLQVQDPAGKIVKDVVVAEARVAGGSQVCDRAAQEDVANGGDWQRQRRQPAVHPAAPSTTPPATSASSPASATATSPTAARR